jgi:hypothetical protein
MSIKRWAIADAITKEITGGIIQNDAPPSVTSGTLTFEVPESLRDEHPESLRVNSTDDGIELKPDSVILAKKKAEREKEITEELDDEASERIPPAIRWAALMSILGHFANESNITSADPDVQAIFDTLKGNRNGLGFTPVQIKGIANLQKGMKDRKDIAKDKIDTIIADGTKTKKEKEEKIKKVKG